MTFMPVDPTQASIDPQATPTPPAWILPPPILQVLKSDIDAAIGAHTSLDADLDLHTNGHGQWSCVRVQTTSSPLDTDMLAVRKALTDRLDSWTLRHPDIRFPMRATVYLTYSDRMRVLYSRTALVSCSPYILEAWMGEASLHVPHRPVTHRRIVRMQHNLYPHQPQLRSWLQAHQHVLQQIIPGTDIPVFHPGMSAHEQVRAIAQGFDVDLAQQLFSAMSEVVSRPLAGSSFPRLQIPSLSVYVGAGVAVLHTAGVPLHMFSLTDGLRPEDFSE